LIFQKKGYVTQEINIQPIFGYEQNLKIRLLTPEQAVLAALPITINTSQGLQMRLVAPGPPVVMGSPRNTQGRRANESERLIQITRPFYVGVREIINKEFLEFNPRHTSRTMIYRELSNGLHPAVMLTWQEAVDFCQKLSSKESLDLAYEKINGEYQLIQPFTHGYRLLTEAEWEWVARFNGGAGKQRYPWGDSMPVEPDSGNFADESAEEIITNFLTDYWDGYPVTSPAGKFSPSPLGIYDLGGNVAEWVNDIYKIYQTNTKQVVLDPLGPGTEAGNNRVIRGSSWRHSSISSLRFTYRDYLSEISRQADVGFRIARYTDTSNIDE
jgi:formylglycine-generating enzyme required for sulfatase activity